MNGRTHGRCLALACAALLASTGARAADAVASFYSGRTVSVLTGFNPGGGYDLYARALARHMGRHIPSNPTLVPQSMPGAGSLRLVNYLFGVAPRDGSVFGTFARGIVLEPLLGHGDGARFDPTRLTWLGSASNEVSVCAFLASSGVRSFDDMRMRSYTIGASAAGADSDVFPAVLRSLFHLPLHIVTGYPGGAEINLAIERHEVDGRCGWSWTSLISRSKALYESGALAVTLQLALAAHEDLRAVPLVMDLAANADDKALLRLILSRQSVARPFAAPPDLPGDRARALREAFAATMRDPEFLAEARALDMEVRPVTGAEIEALLREVYASAPAVVRRAREMLQAP